MATLQQVEAVVRATYANIWNDWYAGLPSQVPATLLVDGKCNSAGYSFQKNELVISLCDGNLNDDDSLNADGWPCWKTDLVHEMLHEYENKVVKIPTPQGKSLFAAYPHPWWGKGHEELFYSAVADRASYFTLTPRQLLDNL